MEQKTLKYLRVLIPGLVFLLGFYPLYDFHFKSLYDAKSLDVTYVTYLSLLFGGIYYQLNIRHIVTQFSLSKINDNIFEKLSAIYPSSLSKDEAEFLKEKKRFKDIFYEIVDNNKSLEKRANNVYFNGIFWSSTADSLIMSFVFAIIYVIYWCRCVDFQNSKTFVVLFLITFAVSLVIHLLSIKKHMTLSDEQVNFIETLKAKEVLEGFNKALERMKPLDNKPDETKGEQKQNDQVLHQLSDSNLKERPKSDQPDKTGVPKK